MECVLWTHQRALLVLTALVGWHLNRSGYPLRSEGQGEGKGERWRKGKGCDVSRRFN